MDVISRSSLNPNAPLFVPCAYRAVEDFSDQWWELVRSTGWYRDYWLQECFQDPQNDLDFSSYDESILPDIDALFFELHDSQQQEEEKEEYYRKLLSLSELNRRGSSRVMAEIPKYSQKAPKTVNVKVNPRPIQQPR